MPEIIEGFSQVEYLLIFNAIVFGAIASEYFSGWGGMLRYREKVKMSPIQFVWSIFAFLLLIQNWFGIWPRAKFINDNAMFFYFSLIPMLLFYLMSVIMFPSMRAGAKIEDFDSHYTKNSRALFILFGIYLCITILGSFIYADVGNVIMQNTLRTLGIILCILCAVYNHKRWLHKVFLTLHFIGLIVFMTQIPE